MVGSLFAQDIDASRMSEIEKQMLYKQNDKSPLLTGICALTPTMGHKYLGEWERVLKSSLPFGLASLPFFGLTEYSHNKAAGYDSRIYKSKDWDEWKIWSNRGDMFQMMGFITLVIWYPLQLQDAVYLAKQHNADLYEEIYGKEYIRPPKKSKIQKWIDKKESKTK